MFQTTNQISARLKLSCDYAQPPQLRSRQGHVAGRWDSGHEYLRLRNWGRAGTVAGVVMVLWGFPIAKSRKLLDSTLHGTLQPCNQVWNIH